MAVDRVGSIIQVNKSATTMLENAKPALQKTNIGNIFPQYKDPEKLLSKTFE